MIQNNPKIIGLTGGIATGKSTVAKIIEKKGYKLVDADKMARDIVKINRPAYSKIVLEFGKEILNDDNSINRKKLGSMIFQDELLREKLNSIVHPYVFQSIKNKIKEYSRTEDYIFLDIPLLIEEREKIKEYKIYFDEIWLVYIDEKTQLKRLMDRDSISKEKAFEKIKSQMPIESKKKYATKIIDNRGNLEILEKQISKILDEYNLILEG